jgi:hypothetical protein
MCVTFRITSLHNKTYNYGDRERYFRFIVITDPMAWQHKIYLQTPESLVVWFDTLQSA